MPAFHLDALWHADAAAMEFVLTNLGDAPVRGFRLFYGSLTRTLAPSRCTGGTLVRRQANYHEYAPPEDLELAPGAAWRFSEANLTRVPVHANEGPKTAGVVLADGTLVPVAVADLQSAPAGGAATAEGTAEAIGLLPWPETVRIVAWRPAAPVHIRPEAPSVAEARAAVEVSALAQRLFPLAPTPFVLAAPDPAVALRFAADPDQPADGYALSFDGDVITLRYGPGSGLLYGLISLAQMQIAAREQPAAFAFPLQGRLRDAPRHGWRGSHLDVSRQAYPLESVLRFVDILAWHKLNRLHWHLTDDEGWRLEIKAYPQLTEAAAHTGLSHPILPQLGPDPAGHGGFYTQDQARQVVDHAAALGVAVMPEIDLPGHCACVLGALPALKDPDEPGGYASIQGFSNNALNPAIDETYRFVEAVLDEVCAVFPFEVIHIGGDEVAEDAWRDSPLAQALVQAEGLAGTPGLQAWFLQRIHAYLRGKGRIAGGWEEVAQQNGIGPEGSLLFAWTQREKTAELARAGYDVISTPGQSYYLDMAQSDAWYEPGASWAGSTPVSESYGYEAALTGPGLAPRVRGLQACIWSEHLNTRARFNHMVFPRLSAIAEAAWTEPEAKNFDRFVRIAPLMPRL